ncbi:expressed unknown protein [Seminavis robusta]|uniref:Uncharacterized protein n=1 Tax=Seminavis robusta TaxID=568900 RepID=A0A9N8H7Y9_9STRA|nr:expressed unknown protein [Seminavis robusta]|eukprot:Sro143_g066640.1 n/a (265) ;mRNA; f:57809-58603
MSKSCAHSMCVQCIQKRDSNNNNDNKPASFCACPVCQAPKAFHLQHCHPNLLAIAALDVMEQCVHILKEQSKEIQKLEQTQSSSAKRGLIPAKKRVSLCLDNTENSPTNNNAGSSKEAAAANAAETSSPLEAPQQQKQGKKKKTAKTNQKKSKSVVTDLTDLTSPENKVEQQKLIKPIEPGKERLVWIKFDGNDQLAFLLAVKDDKANIRWDGYKYEQWIDADRIRELDDLSGSGTRSRRKRGQQQTEHESKQLNQKRRTTKGQ